MLVKWIACQVEAPQRAAFDEAQRAWAPLALSVGLVAQVGGWDQDGRACILALWQDGASYERFMDHVHDAVTTASAQERTYRHCSVTLGEGLVRMPGAAATLRRACAEGALLRVADCTVRPGHRDHFVGAQLSVWAPGMQAAPGMLGGLFSAMRNHAQHYLVSTLWHSEADHAAYVQQRLPELRQRAGTEQDLAALRGHQVRLEPGWRVLGG